MDVLKIIAIALISIGAVINYGARLFVNHLGLAEKMKVTEAQELNSEELEKYKLTKAIARVKVVGLLVLLPGVILVFFAFK